MFTGLIEDIGRIISKRRRDGGYDLTIEAKKDFVSEINCGDSISIDGCCLTCEDKSALSFRVHALDESAEKTIIGNYKFGVAVNLERAMRADSRFGGHFVSGHVDAVGSILSAVKTKGKMKIRVLLPGKWGKYLVENDSVSLNGVSLTIKSVYGNEFSLDIIPETLKRTDLQYLAGGDKANIEINQMAKSVYEFINRR
ncbi:MAG: riboflavin synthase [bacterium]|nr:riboflavin synthase [bacterium]